MFQDFLMTNNINPLSSFYWSDEDGNLSLNSLLENQENTKKDKNLSRFNTKEGIVNKKDYDRAIEILREYEKIEKRAKISKKESETQTEILGILADKFLSSYYTATSTLKPNYIPSERIFVSALEYSWPGLMRDDIGLSKSLLTFANSFSLARKTISELDIDFLNVKYIHTKGRDFIKIPEREDLLMLLETASGIQSVTPLLVLIEHLSKDITQTHSFIIEEPELNLFPIAQFELLKILIHKCSKLDSKNDLIITTHSPYILTGLNLLCYAYRLAQQDESTAKKVAKLIPRKYWIDPDQFAAYYVNKPDTKQKQQVRSIINKKTGLIEENELDNASEELSSIFDKLLRLRQPTKPIAKAAK